MGEALAGDAPPALGAVAEFLICPVCGDGLRPAQGGGLRCASRHSFDRARQGYVSLLTGGTATGMGDTAEMVKSREEFLAAGHYAPAAAMLADFAAHAGWPTGRGLVVDAGAGTGYYLRSVLDRLPAAVGLALDISKPALRRAARAHPRACAVAWDIRQPFPIRPGVASLVLNVFAPRNGAEFRRILRPDGALLVVTPTAAHLGSLMPALGLLSVDSHKDARMERSLSPHFVLEQRDERALALNLPRAHIKALVRMGPSAHHLRDDEIERRTAALAEPVCVTASFAVSVYRPR
ncbi:MAG: putative RNA methyltransferase [Micromonosporaceae bacterium]